MAVLRVPVGKASLAAVFLGVVMWFVPATLVAVENNSLCYNAGARQIYGDLADEIKDLRPLEDVAASLRVDVLRQTVACDFRFPDGRSETITDGPTVFSWLGVVVGAAGAITGLVGLWASRRHP